MEKDATEEAVTGQANINRQKGDPWTAIAPKGAARNRSRSSLPSPVTTSHRHKRPLKALERVELTDRATTAIEDHLEQDYQCATNLTRGAQHTEAWTGNSKPGNLAQNQTESITTETEITSQVSSDIPEWVLAESEAMSREVIPPTQCFFRDSGEHQDGDCCPAAVIGTLYYVYCQTGVKRTALESLMTYSAIRQFSHRPPSATNASSGRPGRLHTDGRLAGGTTQSYARLMVTNTEMVHQL